MDCLAPRPPEGVVKQATGARKGRSKPANLREQVDPTTCEIYEELKNWPTPRVGGQGFNASEMKRNSPNLETTAMMNWPTARTSDAEGGRIETEFKDGTFRSKRSKSDQWFGAKLRDAVETHEEVKRYPTPSANEHQFRLSGDSQASKCLEALARKGDLDPGVKNALNPDWVETLMDIPVGATNPDAITESSTRGVPARPGQEQFDYEPPRVTDSKAIPHRTDRLRMLGNGVYPPTAYKAFKHLIKDLKCLNP